MTTLIQAPQLSRRDWLFLFVACFILLFFNQFIEQILNRQMMVAMQNESSGFIITAAGLFLNGVSIVWLQAIVVMTLFQKQHPETVQFSLKTKISDFSREWLRSMGEASLWMFAFILPGLIRWVDYTMLPFVCFFDKDYQAGNIDALVRCRELAKGHRGKLWSLWIGLGIILPLVLTSLFGDYESLFEYPLAGTSLIFLDSMLQMLAAWILWRIYLKARPLS